MANERDLQKAEMVGPSKGDFVAPPNSSETDDVEAGLPSQDEFWRPPVRFGTVPVEKEPLGWDRRRGYRKLFPQVALPFQIVDRVTFGHRELEPNRLFWGDNLHIMRQLPSESIDLIYIDPPFFSGRQYNVIFGDQNELRSFSDIWEGGMVGYLVWLNARLFEMKRLLKKTGSIYVHCDWHAGHYIKAELDKIFGHSSFMNEIVWYYYNKMHDNRKPIFPRTHDVIFSYARDPSCKAKFHLLKEKREEPKRQQARVKDRETGRAKQKRDEDGNLIYYMVEDRTIDDVWRIPYLMPADKSERIGYPTQKPLELVQRIIECATDPGDVVADFFCGGGSTLIAAQGLRAHRDSAGNKTLVADAQPRRWIGCDQSRVAVAITADRITQTVEERIGKLLSIPDFTVEHWGIYEARRLSEAPSDQFRQFVLRAFGATPEEQLQDIHGLKGAVPVWVGESDPKKAVTGQDVQVFANAVRKTLRYKQDNLRDGIMLAWAFRPDAVEAAERLRRLEQTDLNFIRLEQVRIDSPRFREHVAALSTEHADYQSFLTFVQAPRVEAGFKRLGPRFYKFDVSETVVMNAGAKIINVQWDFDYRERFTSTKGYSFVRGGDKEPALQAEYEFPSSGTKRVACKVQDDMGGEGLWTTEIEVH